MKETKRGKEGRERRMCKNGTNKEREKTVEKCSRIEEIKENEKIKQKLR